MSDSMDLIMRLMQAMKDGQISQSAIRGLLQNTATLAPLAEAMDRGEVRAAQFQKISEATGGANSWITCVRELLGEENHTQELVNRIIDLLKLYKASVGSLWNSTGEIISSLIIGHAKDWPEAEQALAKQLAMRVRGLCGQAATWEDAKRILGKRFVTPDKFTDYKFTPKELTLFEALPWTEADLTDLPDDAVLFPYSTNIEYTGHIDYTGGDEAKMLKPLDFGWKIVCAAKERQPDSSKNHQNNFIPPGYRRSLGNEILLYLSLTIKDFSPARQKSTQPRYSFLSCGDIDPETNHLLLSRHDHTIRFRISTIEYTPALPLTRLPNPEVTSLK